ncbi:hypothetical protein [Bifidobacterium platyrrhinorum]|nr:hypothetical protein [Bifidobacterium platyrrhinorum]
MAAVAGPGAANPWRGVRPPLVGVLVGAVLSALYIPLGYAFGYASMRFGAASYTAGYWLSHAVDIGNAFSYTLTMFMALAAMIPLIDGGRRGRRIAADVTALVLAVLNMAFSAAMLAGPYGTYLGTTNPQAATRLTNDMRVALGLTPVAMAVVLLVLVSSSNRTVPPEGPVAYAEGRRARRDGASGRAVAARLAVVAVVMAVLALLGDIAYGAASPADGGVAPMGVTVAYLLTNGLMLVVCTFLPLLYLGDRLRRATGATVWRTVPLAGLIVGGLSRLVSFVFTVLIQWNQTLYAGKAIGDQRYLGDHRMYAAVSSIAFTATYVVAIVVAVVMIVGASKAMRTPGTRA